MYMGDIKNCALCIWGILRTVQYVYGSGDIKNYALCMWGWGY